jgi:hypothetical protein
MRTQAVKLPRPASFSELLLQFWARSAAIRPGLKPMAPARAELSLGPLRHQPRQQRILSLYVARHAGLNQSVPIHRRFDTGLLG